MDEGKTINCFCRHLAPLLGCLAFGRDILENEGYDGYQSRLRILGVCMVLVIAILIGRAGYLQIYEGDYYAGLADGNRIRIIPSMAPRGTFYDRNGQLLVTNRPGFTVSLLPLTSPIKDDVIERLSKLVNVPASDIKDKIAAHSGFNPIRIKTDVTPDIVSIDRGAERPLSGCHD